MLRTKTFLIVAALASVSLPARAEGPAHRRLAAVPFASVKIEDEFWTPRLATNREKSLPHNFAWCEKTGRISNFDKAAGKAPGKFEGMFFNDSDLYKVLEGASYSLADRPDPALEKTVDDIIARIAAAQQKDGYLNTYFTLVEPQKRWTQEPVKHELYCAGHLIEAAVAHWRATGKRTLLDVAIRFADHIDRTFGPEKRLAVPGHEEIELALVKLYEATGQERYFKLAKFFIDLRGDASKRKLTGPYAQDQAPVRQQTEIVGHAVRAMYLFSGVADVAAYSGDQELIGAMDRLWQDVVGRKMYVTGGIGARHKSEAFGAAYELPNDSAYCETCAAIGLAFWAHRLNLLHADARYADVLERALYNGILSGIALDGQHFFYVNPLASAGKHHRQQYYPCACCPTNVARLVPSVPGYVYAVGEGVKEPQEQSPSLVKLHPSLVREGKGPPALYVNLYIAGTAQVSLGLAKVSVRQDTRYPWNGNVKITLTPDIPVMFDVCLRIPAWCRGAAVTASTSEGKGIPRAGYYVLHPSRPWKAGDTIDVNLEMPIERIEANPAVKADVCCVAIERGPIVYCFEGVDNGGRAQQIVLPRDPHFAAEHGKDLLHGVTVVRGVDDAGRPILAVPYYAWDHREPGEMAVWVRQAGKPPAAAPGEPSADDPPWRGLLYRPLDPAVLGPAAAP
ncbi:MAG: beta-L-arabinofuranosidase domain-containing protein [Thermoguttaceae bacterium]|jgi:hypothetical protein